MPDRFCGRCGQDRGRTAHVPLGALLGEAFGEVLSVDGRMARTVLPFLLRPGHLTAEFLAGRRVRYSSPLRLYLLTTLAFFLAVSLQAPRWVHAPTGTTFEVTIGPEAGPGGADAGPTSLRKAGGGAAPAAPADTGPTSLRRTGGGATPAAPADTGPTSLRKAGGGATPAAPADALPRSDELGAEVQKLRARFGLAGVLLAGGVDTLRHLPREEADRRLAQSMLAQAPRVLFFLVPVMAGLLALLFRRSGLFYAEHFVFSLHAHALGFAALLPGAALGLPGASAAGVAAAALHLLLALRRVYRRGWPGTLVRFAALGVLYLFAFALGLALTALLALAFV